MSHPTDSNYEDGKLLTLLAEAASSDAAPPPDSWPPPSSVIRPSSCTSGDANPSIVAMANPDSLYYQGIVRFPCRARNASDDHNSLTGYFCIPINNAMHGIELICSHPKCQMEGVKFRFCAHCRMPAAKRNFSRRHMHGIPHVLTALPYKKPRLAKEDALTNDDRVSRVIAPPLVGLNRSSTSLISAFSVQDPISMSPLTTAPDSRSHFKREDSPPHCLTSAQPLPVAPQVNSNEKKVPQAWIDLYHSRPTKEKMDSQAKNKSVPLLLSPSPATKHWLLRVLAEVDPNVPLPLVKTPPKKMKL